MWRPVEVEMLNRLVVHPHVGIEEQGVPVPHQCQEEELPQNLAVKIGGNSIYPGETESC